MVCKVISDYTECNAVCGENCIKVRDRVVFTALLQCSMQTIEWGIIITLGQLGAVSVCVYSWQCSVIGRQPLSTLYCTNTGLLVGGWESKTQESEHRTARESDGTQHTHRAGFVTQLSNT